MRISDWLNKNTHSLKGKKIAVTGATGGIGVYLCRYLLKLEASLVLMDRNREKSFDLIKKLNDEFPNAEIHHITTDLSNFSSVKSATEQLIKEDVDIFIHNAGAYSIPRYKCDTGYDNVFQINFISPYYIICSLMPFLKAKNGRVIVTGSIAHRYSKSDINDIDFSLKKQSSLVYGNAKRYLMFSLYELFKDEKQVTLSVVHPGITFTGITNHYPKLIFAIIKNPMKIIFMNPRKACLSTVLGVFKDTYYHTWIGPKFFDIWGFPALKTLKINPEESKKIGITAEKIYKELNGEQNREYKTFSF